MPSASKTESRPRMRPRGSAFDIRPGRAMRRPTIYYVPWTGAEQRWLRRRSGLASSFRSVASGKHVLACMVLLNAISEQSMDWFRVEVPFKKSDWGTESYGNISVIERGAFADCALLLLFGRHRLARIGVWNEFGLIEPDTTVRRNRGQTHDIFFFSFCIQGVRVALFGLSYLSL